MPKTTSPTPPTTAAVPAMLDAGELAAVLRCKPRTIAAYERAGKLPPAVRIGRRRLWPAETVSALLHQGAAA